MGDPEVSLHTGTETSSGVTAAIPMPANTIVGLFVNVSAVSGILPTLLVKLQQSPNGTDWYDVPQASGIFQLVGLAGSGLYPLYPANNPQYVCDTVRCVWTITGVGPSFTFDASLGLI